MAHTDRGDAVSPRPADLGEGWVVVPAAVWADLVDRILPLPRLVAPCPACARPTPTGDVCAPCWTWGQG